MGYSPCTLNEEENLMDNELAYLREQLKIQLRGADAHIPLETALKGFPWERAGDRIPNLAHTVWTLVWHIEICMDDIISYVRNENYQEREFPSGLWPDDDGPASEEEWNGVLDKIRRDFAVLDDWVETGDLFAPLEANGNHTLFRQLRIIGQHNSYHLAQIVDARMLLGVPVKDW